MGTDADWPLQRAVLDALRRDQAVRSHLGDPPRILDRPDPAADLPLLIYGAGRSRSWHSATFDGQEHDIVLDLRSGAGGSGRVREIAASIIDVLHDADLPLPGHALIDLQFEESETRFEEADGSYRCKLRFKGLTVAD